MKRKKAFSDNVLPPRQLNFRNRPRRREFSQPVVRGADAIERVFLEAEKRRSRGLKL